MSEKDAKNSFWTTLPGCLTGLAAILTATVGLITVYYTVVVPATRPTPTATSFTAVAPATNANAIPPTSATLPTFTAAPTPDYSVQEINNDDPGISYSGDCGYNHGLSSLLYNDDVQICDQQGSSFSYTFTGKSIYLVTAYYQDKGGTISCYIDNSFTQSYNLNSGEAADPYGFAYGVVLPIAPTLAYRQHTASCQMTSTNTTFFIDALIVNK